MWIPPDPADAETVASRLREYDAREWQIGLTASALADAITSPKEAGPQEPAPQEPAPQEPGLPEPAPETT
jgi:ribonuclease D